VGRNEPQDQIAENSFELELQALTSLRSIDSKNPNF